MPKVAVYNMQGQAVGELELADSVFAVSVNDGLLHDAVVMYLANQRQGTVATKNRSLVRGGGRKPWRQKGTGRARQGSIRAPHWKGGGAVFGPQPRDHSYTMPRKARRNALRSALSAKLAAGGIRVLDSLAFDEPKTRDMAAVLSNLQVGGKALIVSANHDTVVYKSARNIPGVMATAAADLNVYEVLGHANLVLTLDAVKRVEEVLGR